MSRFKPLLTFEGKTFVEVIVDKLLSVSSTVCVITGFHAPLVEEEISRCYSGDKRVVVVENDQFRKGMLTSLQSGIRHLTPVSEWVMYHFIDQPHLPLQFYHDFKKQTMVGSHWLQPAYRNKKGHPILIHKSLFESILSLEDNQSLRELEAQKSISKHYWDCPYNQILEDFDTDQDLRRSGIQP